eukprot:7738255-Heterocapsa_arctica.AAC.1
MASSLLPRPGPQQGSGQGRSPGRMQGKEDQQKLSDDAGGRLDSKRAHEERISPVVQEIVGQDAELGARVTAMILTLACEDL